MIIEANNIITQTEINRLGINITKNVFLVDRDNNKTLTKFLGYTNNTASLSWVLSLGQPKFNINNRDF